MMSTTQELDARELGSPASSPGRSGGWADVGPSSVAHNIGKRLSRWRMKVGVRDMLTDISSDISTMNPGKHAYGSSPMVRHRMMDGDAALGGRGRGQFTICDEDEEGDEDGTEMSRGRGLQVEEVHVVSSENYVMSEKNREAAAQATRSRAAGAKLGTFKGVFLPCFQNILGVILWIRLPYITGQAGIFQTMGIVALSKFCTLMTTLSMSALATNGTVQAGGPYYIISRNLGVEIGGAIGTLFYLGTTIAASMYVLGAVETIESSFGYSGEDFVTQIMALVIMAVLVLTVGVGVKYVNMSSVLFLGVVLFSLASIVLGGLLFAVGAYNGQLTSADRILFDNFGPVYAKNPDTGVTPTFFSLLAMFFPAATGIMAGCNRSAVLASPGKSIPKGTLNAIGSTTALYLLFIWLFGCSVANSTLIEDKLIEMRVAWPTPYMVAAGIIFSCFGAALQCLVGASGLLAAIASDLTIPFLVPFAPRPDEEPIRAVLLTGMIAALPCLAGNLDYIAVIITMFFLLMYGSVNLSCFVLTSLNSPGFRPQFRYSNSYTALTGLAMCLALMLIISWHWAMLAIILAFGLLGYIKYQNASRDWGDALAGFRFQLARDMLLTMGRDGAVHAKNWRPQLLLFLDIDSKGNPKTPELLSLAGQMKLGRGLLLAVGLLKGDPAEEMERAAEAQRVLSMHLEDENIEGFAEVSVCADPREAAMTVMHHAGIGTMRPNAVFVNWCDDWSKNHDKGIAFVSMLRGAVRANKAAMVLKGALALPSQFETLSQGDTIDIWWIAHDGGLLLLVPYLLTLHSVWKRCQLRLYSVIVDERDDPRVVEREVRDYLEQIRIEAIVTAIDMSDSRYNSEAYTSEMNSRSQAAKDSNIGVGRVTASDTHGRKEGLGVQLDDDVEELEELELEDSSAAGGAHGTPAQRGKQKKYNRTKEGDSRTVAAVLLNRNMRRISSRARLIVTNLPLVPDMAAIEILEYVETISDSLSPVLLIRGTGQEVVTTIA